VLGWSADGRSLLTQRWGEDDVCTLRALPVDGGWAGSRTLGTFHRDALVRAVQPAVTGGPLYWVRMSLQEAGERAGLGTADGGQPPPVAAGDTSGYSIRTMSLDPSETLVRTVVAQRDGARAWIVSVELQSGSVRLLSAYSNEGELSGRGDSGELDFSPDGARLALPSVMVAGREHDCAPVLTIGKGEECPPAVGVSHLMEGDSRSWSPDGLSRAAIGERQNGQKVLLVSRKGEGFVPVLEGYRTLGEPARASDGTLFVLESNELRDGALVWQQCGGGPRLWKLQL
jgi:hypothetical protein